MGSVLSITGSSMPLPPAPVAPAAAATPAQPTITQLLEEPTFELSQQAQAGNPQAAQVLAQQQAADALIAPTTAAAATGAVPGVPGINILA